MSDGAGAQAGGFGREAGRRGNEHVRVFGFLSLALGVLEAC